jgi:uncharacterized membrane protein YraQ (UPF0718 family)
VNRNTVIEYIGAGGFVLFLFISYTVEFNPDKMVLDNFLSFFFDMMKVLPCAFICIGLFDVWVKNAAIRKHLSGVKGPVFVIVLAGTTVGGLYVALPVACTLFRKGAKLRVIFTYIFASAIFRVPMTMFEASFLGIKFTLIRLLTSLPLIIVTSIMLEKYLEKKNYELKEVN